MLHNFKKSLYVTWELFCHDEVMVKWQKNKDFAYQPLKGCHIKLSLMLLS